MKVYDPEGRLKVNALAAFGDSSSLDAFGRLRVASPVGLFDSQFTYDTHSLLWETTTSTASATHVPGDATVLMSLTSGNSAQSALRQSKQYIRYQPGRSQLVFITFNFVEATAQASVTKEVGYGDASEGIFLTQAGTGTALGSGIWLSVRKTGVDSAIAQSAWNIDKMDGTGPSRVTLNWTKAQILAIDMEWLGVGRVRVGFVVDGVLYPVHEFLHANSVTTTYMKTANLPIRYYIGKTKAVSTGDLLQICSAVFSEGGFEVDRALPFSFGNSTSGISVTTRRAIISIRPQGTFNSLVTRGTILPMGFELAVTSAATQTVYWELIYNPTYTTGGGALTWTAADANSIVEYSVHGDANAGAFTSGTRILSGYINSANSNRGAVSQEILSRLPLVLDSNGANPIALALVCTATGATTCFGALNWKELR